MAKDRIEICKFYKSYGEICEKEREAEHGGYCQRCDKYVPRMRKKHLNRKKIKLAKIRKKEYRDE